MQVTTLDKEKAGRPIVESRWTGLWKNMLHPVLMKAAGTALTFRVVKDNECRLLPDRPVLYAANHYCGQDIIIGVSSLKERVLVVAGKQGLTPIDELFFNANGVIFVDRMDKEDMAASKRAMVENLKNGRNVLIFPEGTSNVSDELLMYPMKWGVVAAAQEAGAQIVPVILDYDKEAGECHVCFCDPILVDELSKEEGIRLLRDTMATVRYTYFEKHPAAIRAEMNIEEEQRENKRLLLSYEKLDYEYEKSVVFHPWVTWEEVFAPVAAIHK